MSLFFNNELLHYGVKGMRWGVRRYQNYDGSLTYLGKWRYDRDTKIKREAKTRDAVNSIVETFDDNDKINFGISSKDDYYYVDGESLIKRILISDKSKTPVSFFDLNESPDGAYVVIGTRSGSEYRDKGYATKAAKAGMDWIEKNKDKLLNEYIDEIEWRTYDRNKASNKLAKKSGFKYDYSYNNRYNDYLLDNVYIKKLSQ